MKTVYQVIEKLNDSKMVHIHADGQEIKMTKGNMIELLNENILNKEAICPTKLSDGIHVFVDL